MPYIISVTSGKEKVVKAEIAKRCPIPPLFDLLETDLAEYQKQIQSIDSSISPFSGFLVCEAIPPLRLREIRNLPHVQGLTEATSEQVKGMMTGLVKRTSTKNGRIVQMVRGEYIGLCGIVRKIEGNVVSVDLGIYGKMINVRVPVDDVKGLSHED
ncbi:MAG: hypothetical protein WCJ37_02060 [Syntrophus sp. (in: bacteria)]